MPERQAKSRRSMLSPQDVVIKISGIPGFCCRAHGVGKIRGGVTYSEGRQKLLEC